MYMTATPHIPVERAEKLKKEAKQAKQQLINEDDMSDPLQSASFKRFSKLLDIIFEHEDEMVPENFKLSKRSIMTCFVNHELPVAP